MSKPSPDANAPGTYKETRLFARHLLGEGTTYVGIAPHRPPHKISYLNVKNFSFCQNFSSRFTYYRYWNNACFKWIDERKITDFSIGRRGDGER